MRRAGLTAVFLLLLGIATAVTVAWGITLLTYTSFYYSGDYSNAGWTVSTYGHPGFVVVFGSSLDEDEEQEYLPLSEAEWSSQLPGWSCLNRPPDSDEMDRGVAPGYRAPAMRWTVRPPRGRPMGPHEAAHRLDEPPPTREGNT